ncbi:HTH domain-containing protein [Marinilactibacillus psychrotolerans]|uniref:HTH domain-containing protein n=1 Tax=Marinilactibacillus psychrotolerans TaxID=191770 RepID=UPI0038842319
MGKNYFTEEERKKLEENPYVEKVSLKAITYTETFKEHFAKEKALEKGPTQIFRDADFDVAVLGKDRIKTFSRRIKTMSHRLEGYTDLRSEPSGRPPIKERTQEEEIAYLRHKVALQEQQIEALKKTNFIHREAKRASHKKNSNSSKT